MKRIRKSSPSAFSEAIGVEFAAAAREAVARARSAGLPVAGLQMTKAETAKLAGKRSADVIVAAPRRLVRAKAVAKKGG
jgi:hypothetical protein